MTEEDTGINKRKYERFSVSGLSGNTLFASDVKIHNISLGGMAVETERRLTIGREYALKLKDGERTVVIKGVIVWSIISDIKMSPNGDSVPVYQAGVQFTNVLSENAQALVDFLERHKTGAESRLGGVRFRIDPDNAKATLDVPFGYTVKKISLSGMLIETEQQFNIDDRFEMELTLPTGGSFKFAGRVASNNAVKGEKASMYNVGIEFSDMTEENRKSLKEFVEGL